MRRAQFEPLVVLQKTEDFFHAPWHTQTYYELIFIEHGSGVHLLNTSKLRYEENDLFIVSPEDTHFFEVEESTRFVFILFTDDFLNRLQLHRLKSTTVFSPENIMRLRRWKEMKLPLTKARAAVLRETILGIATHYDALKDSRSDWLVYQILSVFGIIRMISQQYKSAETQPASAKENLISYINEHIYYPELIQRKALAAYFNISNNYFSTYFKRNFGITLQQYIQKYRLKLIEQRLMQSDMSVKAIALEFGFVDESHLIHFFKKQKAVSPIQYRKAHFLK